MEDGFFFKYFSISVLMIIVGVATRVYFKKVGLDDLNKVLGVGVHWLKFAANTLIIIGGFCVIVLLITFYYYLKSIESI